MTDANRLLGEALLRVAAGHVGTGNLGEAANIYRQVLAILPDCVPALHNLGVIALEQGAPGEGADYLRHAVKLAPDDSSAFGNLGLALIRLGQLDEAVSALREAARLDGTNAASLYNLGNLLLELGFFDEAEQALTRAVALRPGHAQSHNSLGAVLLSRNKNQNALACFERATSCDPALAGAAGNKGLALTRLGRFEDAVAAFANAERLAPGSSSFRLAFARAQMCDWSRYEGDMEDAARAAREGNEEIQPFALLNLADDPLLHLDVARRWAKCWEGLSPVVRVSSCDKDRIRVGYLSGDYRTHAVATLIAELIERHDRKKFEIMAYSIGPDDGSALRERFLRSFDGFVDLNGVSHDDAARRIALDRIDILVDLAGYTELGRTRILGRRPAPVQVNYLGYPGTMGADFVDYILVDPIVAPMSHQSCYAEKLVQLPFCYQPNDSKRLVDPAPPSRSAAGLPEDGFVFSCLNGPAKISRPVFGAWMAMLKEVDGSVLWLLDGGEMIRRNQRREAERLGVAPDRLVYAAKLPPEKHLARLPLADLFLDTMPYNAHTTASEALWMGVPVVTMLGQSFQARVAASLVAAAGVPELAAGSFDDYRAMALSLAGDTERLAVIRGHLTSDRDRLPLFDIGRYTKHIEAAFNEMWTIHRQGDAPRAFAVSAD